MKKISPIYALIIACIVLALEVTRQILYVVLDLDVWALFLTSSLLILLMAILIRFCIIKPKVISAFLKETDIIIENREPKQLKPIRFLNLMPLAMLFCSIADYVIHQDFIIGMLLFLVAQLFYIVAYTGIVHLNPKILLSMLTKRLTLFSTFFWIILTIMLYFTLLFSPSNIITILIVPYMIVLMLNALVASWGLGYKKRNLFFRLLLFAGAILFFISDAILAINKFSKSILYSALWIGATYLLAVFLLQFAVLSLKSNIT